MTLEDWCHGARVVPQSVPGSRLVSVFCDILEPCRRDLWKLSDYLVSSTSGVSVYLIPRSAK